MSRNILFREKSKVSAIVFIFDWIKNNQDSATTSFIGGSFALKGFIQDYMKIEQKWNSNDIDVFLVVNDISSFDSVLEKFASIVKFGLRKRYSYFDNGQFIVRRDRDTGLIASTDDEKLDGNEGFTKHIIATETFSVPHFPEKLQFIALERKEWSLNPNCIEDMDFHATICDLPSNVRFRYEVPKIITLFLCAYFFDKNCLACFSEGRVQKEIWLEILSEIGLVIRTYAFEDQVMEGLRRGYFYTSGICSSRRAKYEERGFVFKDQ